MSCEFINDTRFRAEATKEQEKVYKLLGGRSGEHYDRNDQHYLDLKIGFALFGPPQSIGSDPSNTKEYYTPDQRKKMNEFSSKLFDLSDTPSSVTIAFIYIIGREKNGFFKVPLVRMFMSKHDNWFVDENLRVYEGFDDYLSSNKLPQCAFCYPQDGIYLSEGTQLKVGFASSPNCSETSEVLGVVDSVASVASIVSGAVGIASIFFPFLAPVVLFSTAVAVSSGLWTTGRSVGDLVDRSKHHESIGLGSAEGRNDWLNIFGTVLSAGTMGAAAYSSVVAKSGELLSRIGNIGITALNVTNISVNGLGTMNALYTLIVKYKQNSLTTLDVVQFTMATFFFTHSMINYRTANQIITNAQHDVIEHFKKGQSEEHSQAFDHIYRNTVGDELRTGNAKVIKAIKHVRNPNEFFESLLQVDKEALENNSYVVLTEKGLIKINDELIIHPWKYTQIAEESRGKIYENTKMLRNNEISGEDFKKSVESICRSERIHFEIHRRETLAKMSTALGNSDLQTYEINGKKIFSKLQPHEIDRLDNVMMNTVDKYNSELTKVMVEVANDLQAQNVTDFCSFAEFTKQYMLEARDQISEGSKKSKFLAIVEKMKHKKEVYQTMLEQFRSLKQNIEPINERTMPSFRNVNAATYHYYKHKVFGTVSYTPEQYFELMQDLFGKEEMITKRTMSQEGDTTIITFNDNTRGLIGVKMEKIVNAKDIDVFAATLYYDQRIIKRT